MRRSRTTQNWLALAWNDLRDDWKRLEGAKVMGGLLIFPVALGIAWTALHALGLAH